MKRRPIGAIELNGEWHVIFREEEKRDGWTFHAGMTSVPAPDMERVEIDAQLEREIMATIKAQPEWIVRRQELEDARKA
jgi:hypothetical protein